MSKIKLEAPFQEYRGKICKHSQVIYKQMYDTKYTSQICNPHEDNPTAAQQAHREKFKQVRAKVLALTEEEKNAYQKAFDKQDKYNALQGYIFAQEFAKLAMIILCIMCNL